MRYIYLLNRIRNIRKSSNRVISPQHPIFVACGAVLECFCSHELLQITSFQGFLSELARIYSTNITESDIYSAITCFCAVYCNTIYCSFFPQYRINNITIYARVRVSSFQCIDCVFLKNKKSTEHYLSYLSRLLYFRITGGLFYLLFPAFLIDHGLLQDIYIFLKLII